MKKEFPYRAVWVLPKMSVATATDRAVLRFLCLVAAAEDMSTVKVPGNDTPHAWASAVLPPPSGSMKKLVDNRPPLGEFGKNALKLFHKRKREEERRAKAALRLAEKRETEAVPRDASHLTKSRMSNDYSW